jgi:hypothetical protein
MRLATAESAWGPSLVKSFGRCDTASVGQLIETATGTGLSKKHGLRITDIRLESLVQPTLQLPRSFAAAPSACSAGRNESAALATSKSFRFIGWQNSNNRNRQGAKKGKNVDPRALRPQIVPEQLNRQGP